MRHEQRSAALRGASQQGPAERRARTPHTVLPSRPLVLGPAAVVGLQRSVGNAVVSRMISGPPADLQRACGPGCTDCSSCVEEAEQRDEGKPSAQRVPELQRDDEASEGDPSLVAELEREIEAVTRNAGQDGDLGLRANANRASLLLRFRAHPRFETRAQVGEFIDRARQLARTELDTLTALGPAGAELAMATTPKGFRSPGPAGSTPRSPSASSRPPSSPSCSRSSRHSSPRRLSCRHGWWTRDSRFRWRNWPG